MNKKNLTIAVNVRHLIPNKMEGIGWFSYQMMKRITQNHPEVHFYFLFDRSFDSQFIFAENITPIILSPPARHPLLIYYWNEFSIPNLLNKLNPDVYVSLDGFISKRAKYKQYAVIHDLNFLVYPEYLSWSVCKLYNYFFKKHIYNANRIATVSEFSKSEIIKYLNIPEDKIDVVFSASNLKFREIKDEESIYIKNQYTDGKDYFLFLSSIHPRKNLIGTIKAFNLYKEKTKSEDKLVLVGRFFWGKDEITTLVNESPFKHDIKFTGRLEDDKLLVLMKFAKALIMVSHYEGFGVPVIEAMQLGTPVITSNTTALNEIAGDAAIKVAPTDIKAITEAMQLINDNKELVNDLIIKGKIQSQKFNWDDLYERLWQGILKTIEEK